jgi:Asp-tRNA(Asn)/Glu-tRNA(Gln) amidotransferase A subunit family amidase
MLDVMAGYDPEDPVTARGVGKVPASYRTALRPDALRGVRLGLLESFMGTSGVHQPVNAVVREAVARVEGLGAAIVPVEIDGLDALTRDLSLMRLELAAAFDGYCDARRTRARADAGRVRGPGRVPPVTSSRPRGGASGGGRAGDARACAHVPAS